MAPRVIAAIRHSAAIAALLSFLWPGLGQGLAGSRRRALLFAVPMMLFLGAGLLVMIVQGKARALGLLLQPSVLLALLALNLAVLLFRVAAIVDAYRVAASRWPPIADHGRAAVGLVFLGVVLGSTLLMHAWLGYVGFKAYDTVVAISHPFSSPTPLPAVSLAPGETPGPTPVPTPVLTPQPAWGDNGRLDLILIGGDAGPGRFSLRTDTMVILSVEIRTGRAALFGVPRNLINVPLPDGPADAFDCRCYPDLLNSIFTYAIAHPDIFPGDQEERGYRAVQESIAKLTGLQIDGQVVVTLGGFVRVVDALGGLEMTTADSIYDARYPDPLSTRNVTLYIPRGFHHFDGWHALAYARSRHQDNDYNRMNRQQEVLAHRAHPRAARYRSRLAVDEHSHRTPAGPLRDRGARPPRHHRQLPVLAAGDPRASRHREHQQDPADGADRLQRGPGGHADAAAVCDGDPGARLRIDLLGR